MAKYSVQMLNSTFGALADGTRRAILERLSDGESTVGDLARPFDMSLPAVSKHLTVLEQAGLIVRRTDGRLRRCRLSPGSISAAADWIGRHRAFWGEQFDRLEEFLESSTEEVTGK